MHDEIGSMLTDFDRGYPCDALVWLACARGVDPDGWDHRRPSGGLAMVRDAWVNQLRDYAMWITGALPSEVGDVM